MRHNNFKDKILENKQVRNEIVKYILKNLDALDYLSRKLIRDKEIIPEFNTDTALLALKASYNVENLYDKLGILEDASLASLIEGYSKEIRQVISAIYNIENNIYTKQKEHHQLLRQYDREFHKLCEEEIHSEKIYELKTAFKNEMQAYKQNVVFLENTYSKQREEMALRLKELNEKNEVVQQMIEDYKRKEIDSKKLYLKEFVYA